MRRIPKLSFRFFYEQSTLCRSDDTVLVAWADVPIQPKRSHAWENPLHDAGGTFLPGDATFGRQFLNHQRPPRTSISNNGSQSGELQQEKNIARVRAIATRDSIHTLEDIISTGSYCRLNTSSTSQRLVIGDRQRDFDTRLG